MQLRRKEECRDTHLEGGYFKVFGDEIPPQITGNTDTNPSTIAVKPTMDNESTTSSSPEEPVTTQEPGAYPAIPVQEYRDGPIEEIAVHYVRINCVIEIRSTRNRQQEDNVRSAESDIMLDIETLINETAADPDLIEVQWRTTNRCKSRKTTN